MYRNEIYDFIHISQENNQALCKRGYARDAIFLAVLFSSHSLSLSLSFPLSPSLLTSGQRGLTCSEAHFSRSFRALCWTESWLLPRREKSFLFGLTRMEEIARRKLGLGLVTKLIDPIECTRFQNPFQHKFTAGAQQSFQLSMPKSYEKLLDTEFPQEAGLG